MITAPAHDRWLAAKKACGIAERAALKARRLGGDDAVERAYDDAQNAADRICRDAAEIEARAAERPAVLQRIDDTRAEAAAALEALAAKKAPSIPSSTDYDRDPIAASAQHREALDYIEHEGPLVDRACAALEAYDAACSYAIATPSVPHDGWSAHRMFTLSHRAMMLRKPGRMRRFAAETIECMAAELRARTTKHHDCCLYGDVAEATKAVERT